MNNPCINFTIMHHSHKDQDSYRAPWSVEATASTGTIRCEGHFHVAWQWDAECPCKEARVWCYLCRWDAFNVPAFIHPNIVVTRIYVQLCEGEDHHAGIDGGDHPCTVCIVGIVWRAWPISQPPLSGVVNRACWRTAPAWQVDLQQKAKLSVKICQGSANAWGIQLHARVSKK